MSSSPLQFDAEYTKGSRPTEAKEEELEADLSQSAVAQAGPSPSMDNVITAERYGTGKPKRVVIRGNTLRE